MRARITPPATQAQLVARPALEARLDEAARRRLTTVIAGAGYGKSTSLAAWSARHRAAWCGLRPGDDDRVRLAALLVPSLELALETSLPELAETVDVLRQRAASAEERWEDAFAALVAEVVDAAGGGPLVLVLDDVHHVARHSSSARLLESVCRYAPPRLHLVLASREEPPFPIEGLRGRGDVLTVDAPLLAFTADEVRELLAARLGRRAAALAEELYELSAGWPAAVSLAIERLAAVADRERPERLRELRDPGSPLFAYLAQEVLDGEPEGVRELLRRAALFDRFSGPLCAALDAADAENTLADLLRRSPFVQRHGEWYSLHELVRDHVLRAWPFAPEEELRLRRRAAEWLERMDELEDALVSLADAGDAAATAAMLRRHGETMLSAGASDAVLRTADALPEGLRDAVIERLAGEAHAMRGEPEAALACLRRAGGSEEAIAPAVGWRLVVAHLLRDDLDAALDVFARTASGDTTRDDALLCGWTAGALLRRGDAEGCRALSERALAAAAESGDARALAAGHAAGALAALADGDAAECEAHLRQALDAAERSRDILQLARIRNSWGSLLLERSSYAEAVVHLDEAMRLAELGGFRTFTALALMNRGLCRWCVGRLDEAMADYEAAIAIYRRTGSREIAYALVGRGDVYRERGDLALARAAYEEGLTIAEAANDLQSLVPALYQLAKVLVNDEPEQALRLAERAVEIGWPDPAWALGALGWVALAAGDRHRAAAAAEDAIAVARGRGDRFGLADALALKAVSAPDPRDELHTLEDALTAWREIGNEVQAAAVELALARLSPSAFGHAEAERALGTLRSLGIRVSAAGAAGLLRTAVGGAVVPVAIQTLGRFQLLRDGVPVPVAAWQSRKARDLLRILVARRGRPLPRDALMEALWPGEDPVEVANRLSVALSTLRSVLDPDKRFDAGHYVTADRDGVALDLRNVRVDVEEFLTAAEAALRADGADAYERLVTVEAGYGGDFLEENVYDDWSVTLREEARALYLEVARVLARRAAANGDIVAATRYLLRVLERDPYDEQAHLALVAALADVGRHGEARRAYRAYCQRLEEIGVEPASYPRAAAAAPA